MSFTLLLSDKAWYAGAILVGLAVFLRHMFLGNATLPASRKRPLAVARAVDNGAAILSLWGGVAIASAVFEYTKFSDLEHTKTPLMIGVLYGLLNTLAKVWGGFQDELET